MVEVADAVKHRPVHLLQLAALQLQRTPLLLQLAATHQCNRVVATRLQCQADVAASWRLVSMVAWLPAVALIAAKP